MHSDRERVPHSTWVALAVAVALLGWVLLGFAGDLATANDKTDRTSRVYVEEALAQAEGVAMVLPVNLPAGYDAGRYYNYSNSGVQTGLEDETEANSREVTYIPIGGVRPDGRPAVVQCVELADAKRPLCPAPKNHMERRLGPTRVIFYVASDYSRDLTAWTTVPLTRDLTKVTWLH